MELLERWLVIEADRQALLAAVQTALHELGDSPMAHALALGDASAQLRSACNDALGAARARLAVEGNTLSLYLDDAESPLLETRLRRAQPPDGGTLMRLQRQLTERFQAQDPEALQKRNERMIQQFNARRKVMEAQLREMQEALDQRQEELAETITRSETDQLTGIYNRRAFDEKAPAAFLRTLRQGTETLCLILVDLDYFKDINDTYGHQYGDEYLQRAAQILREAIRQDVDAAFRIGGDEFAILLFAEPEIACRRGLQILHEMDGYVSIGIAAIHRDSAWGADTSFERFQQTADEALYAAKDAGRGRVALAGCTDHGGATCIQPCSQTAQGAAP